MFGIFSAAVPTLHQVKNVRFNYLVWIANKGWVSESGEKLHRDVKFGLNLQIPPVTPAH